MKGNDLVVVLLNSKDWGITGFIIYDKASHSIKLNKNAANSNIGNLSQEIIWDKYSFNNLEGAEYLCLLDGNSQAMSESIFVVNMETLKFSEIKIDFSTLEDCKFALITNSYIWNSADVISIMINILPNSVYYDNCAEYYQPIVAIINLKNNKITLK